MKCLICNHGETKDGDISVILERDSMTIVFTQVPAHIYANCDEEYVNEQIASRLPKIAEEIAEESLSSGIMVDIRQYKAA